MSESTLHKIDPCPACGALPCDWANDPRRSSTVPWQPIQTAPRDGTAIRLWTGILQADAFWQAPGVISKDGFWCHFLLGQYDFVEVLNPTHWMPLPPAPEAGA